MLDKMECERHQKKPNIIEKRVIEAASTEDIRSWMLEGLRTIEERRAYRSYLKHFRQILE